MPRIKNDDDSSWLLSVSAGRWQVSGILAAQKAGIRVFAIDGDEKALGLAIADQSSVVDIKNPNEVLSCIESKGIALNGVISFASEVGMPAAALIRERYRLQGPDLLLTQALTNKAIQRKLWTEKGIPIPKWRLTHSLDEIKSISEDIGFPVIVKPTDSSGSRGVTKVNNKKELRMAAELALEFSREKAILVESYLSGTEFTVETFSHKGITHVLAITKKRKIEETGGTVAYELTTLDPSPLSEAISKTVVSALEALGYREGPGHTELIVSEDGKIGMVESAGRGGGFMVFERLVPLASGYDIVTACALQAVGWEVPAVNLSRKAVTLRFFPSQPGIVNQIDGFDEVNKMEGVIAEPFVSVGDHCNSVKGDGDRLGYILTQAIDSKTARSLADKAEKMIHFQFKI